MITEFQIFFIVCTLLLSFFTIFARVLSSQSKLAKLFVRLWPFGVLFTFIWLLFQVVGDWTTMIVNLLYFVYLFTTIFDVFLPHTKVSAKIHDIQVHTHRGVTTTRVVTDKGTVSYWDHHEHAAQFNNILRQGRNKRVSIVKTALFSRLENLQEFDGKSQSSKRKYISRYSMSDELKSLGSTVVVTVFLFLLISFYGFLSRNSAVHDSAEMFFVTSAIILIVFVPAGLLLIFRDYLMSRKSRTNS